MKLVFEGLSDAGVDAVMAAAVRQRGQFRVTLIDDSRSRAEDERMLREALAPHPAVAVAVRSG